MQTLKRQKGRRETGWQEYEGQKVRKPFERHRYALEKWGVARIAEETPIHSEDHLQRNREKKPCRAHKPSSKGTGELREGQNVVR